MSDWKSSATAAVQNAHSNSSAVAQTRAQRQQQAQQQYADPSNSVYGTAHRRQLEWQQQQQQRAQGSERCPQCSASFADVQQLIQHVESAHGSGPVPQQQRQLQQQQRQQGVSGGGEVFQCPRCSARFGDAVLLVSHSESCGQAQGNCVLC